MTKAKPPKTSRPPTDTQRLDFLMGLAHGATVKDACRTADIPRRTVYYWRDEDPEFAEAWKHAMDEASEVLKSDAEQVLKNRALNPDDKQSHLLLMFLLKKLDHTYKDNYKQEIVHKHDTGRVFDFSEEDKAKAHQILEEITRESAAAKP